MFKLFMIYEFIIIKKNCQIKNKKKILKKKNKKKKKTNKQRRASIM